MAEQLFNDLVAVALSGAIDASQSSITVSASLSVSGNFRIRIDDELLQVTGVAGTAWTVARGVESSVAAAHFDAARVHIVATAAGMALWLVDNVPASGLALGLAYALQQMYALP